MLKVDRKREALLSAYATQADFCRIFQDEMNRLYVLAFLLTGNHAKAECCFLTALADARKEPIVFKEFAGSWSRRAIIANAVRVAAPTSSQPAETCDLWAGTKIDPPATQIINQMVRLCPMERFVFVLCVLERYGEVECALLLGCARAEVVEARIRAFEKLTSVMPRPPLLEEPLFRRKRDEFCPTGS
jgi:DNA-directed RNA polymerase specialized sigma24 family protein